MLGKIIIYTSRGNVLLWHGEKQIMQLWKDRCQDSSAHKRSQAGDNAKPYYHPASSVYYCGIWGCVTLSLRNDVSELEFQASTTVGTVSDLLIY